MGKAWSEETRLKYKATIQKRKEFMASTGMTEGEKRHYKKRKAKRLAKRHAAKSGYVKRRCQFCNNRFKNFGMAKHEEYCSKNPKNMNGGTINGKNGSLVKRVPSSPHSKENLLHALELKVAFAAGDVTRLLHGYAESIGVSFPVFASRVTEAVTSGLHSHASR